MLHRDGVADVLARIAPYIRRTPAIFVNGLFIKAEHLQTTRNFKIRGAAAVLTARQSEARQRGVVTRSSGNFGVSVARIASLLGIPATIVMPETTPELKVELALLSGAKVVQQGKTTSETMAVARELSSRTGAMLLSPYDDDLVIAASATIAVELEEQVPDLQAVYCPVGGGGLAAGISAYFANSRPSVKVFGVEPTLAADLYQSIAQKTLVGHSGGKSVADGLNTQSVGAKPWEILRQSLAGVVTVSEDEILAATGFLISATKTLVEPSGAVAYAAATKEGLEKSVAIITGGNIESNQFEAAQLAYSTPRSSTSNISSALGGITDPAPRAP